MNREIIEKDFGGGPAFSRIIGSAEGVRENIRFFAQLPALYKQLTESDVDTHFAEVAEGDGNHFVFITHAENLVAAMIFIVVRMPTKRRGLIEDVVVDKMYRRLGLGRILIDEAFSLGREAGCQYIQLTSRPGRTAANDFYPNLGFELVAAAAEGSPRGTNLYRHYL